jgi:hypothetical protein
MLTGFPSIEWIECLNIIHQNLKSFQGDYGSLMESKIIYNLCQLFKPENDAVTWRQDVALLLSDMIIYNKSPMFVHRLLDHDFLRDICRIISDRQAVLMRTLDNYLYLLGNIAGDNVNARNKAISSGAVPIMKQLLEQAVQ